MKTETNKLIEIVNELDKLIARNSNQWYMSHLAIKARRLQRIAYSELKSRVESIGPVSDETVIIERKAS